MGEGRPGRGAVLLVALAACWTNAAAPPPTTPPVSPPATPAAPHALPHHVHAELEADWTDVITTPSCFTFAGPGGRDEQPGTQATVDRIGGSITIALGDEVFVGRYEAPAIAVVRDSEHEDGGVAWDVHETLAGSFANGTITARYHYQECERGGPCPGNCAIDADVEIHPVGAVPLLH